MQNVLSIPTVGVVVIPVIVIDIDIGIGFGIGFAVGIGNGVDIGIFIGMGIVIGIGIGTGIDVSISISIDIGIVIDVGSISRRIKEPPVRASGYSYSCKRNFSRRPLSNEYQARISVLECLVSNVQSNGSFGGQRTNQCTV